jgi:hypothetical protein
VAPAHGAEQRAASRLSRAFPQYLEPTRHEPASARRRAAGKLHPRLLDLLEELTFAPRLRRKEARRDVKVVSDRLRGEEARP